MKRRAIQTDKIPPESSPRRLFSDKITRFDVFWAEFFSNLAVFRYMFYSNPDNKYNG
jgi:hypothetical protein